MRKMNFILIIAALFLFSCEANKTDAKDNKTKVTSEEKSKEVKEGEVKKTAESSANQRAGFPESVRIYSNFENSYKHILYNLKDNSFTYFTSSDATGKGSPLTIKNQKGKVYSLAFPASTETDICTLTLEDEADGMYKSTFVYPDGQKKFFYNIPAANICYSIGTGESQETIVSSGSPIINYFYYSAKFPQGVLLKSLGGDMMYGMMQVSFPQDSKNIYELKEDGKGMTVKNPDGSIQNFKKMD